MRWLRTNKDILAIVLFACVVRLGLVSVLHQQGYTGDEQEYIQLAAKLAEGKSFVDSNGEWSTKAPLFPFMLSVLFRLFGNGLLIPHLVVCVLGTIAVLLGFRLTIEIGESRFVALVTAGLMALYPGLVVYSDLLQTESLYIVFFLLTFLFVVRFHKNPTLLNGALIGVFAGAATLTRAIFFGFFILLLVLLSWTYRSKLRAYAFGIVSAAIVWILLLTPWTIRNYSLHDTFVPISSWGGMSLLLGNNPYSTGTWSSKPGFDDWFAEQAARRGIDLSTSNEIQRSALGRTLAGEFVSSHPGEALELGLKKFYMHWIYPISNSDSNVPLQAICVAADFLMYSLAGIGILTLGNKPAFYPIFFAIIFFTLLQVLLHCEARYRLPIVPFVAIFSAQGVALLADTRRISDFLNIRRRKILACSWVCLVSGVYAFTAWQFLSGKI